MRPGPRRLPRGPPVAPSPDITPSMNLLRAFELAGRRDSGSSLGSSLPSSVGGRQSSITTSILTDRSSQASALQYVNTYLTTLNAPFTLRPPLPSAKDIISTLRFLLSRLDYPIRSTDNNALEEELLSLLRNLGCPCKLTKSALRAPGTPHTWPSILAVLFWLTQLARVEDKFSESDPNLSNDLGLYIAESYSLFLCGDDAAVEDLHEKYVSNMRVSAEVDEGLEKEAVNLEAKLSAMTQGPSAREELEHKKASLMEDQKKFEAIYQNYAGRVHEMEEVMGGLKRELEEKEKEMNRYLEEKGELEKRIGEQEVNLRDVDRMKREMQLIERDIEEAINGKNLMEEKSWEIDAGIVKKLDELDLLVEQSNQALPKLKLEVDFQYVVNANGSSASEIIGENYKTTLKPALKSLDEDLKKSIVSKSEELVSLQGELNEKSRLIEEKKKYLTNLQDKLDEIENRVVLVKNEVEKQRAKFAAEANELKADLERKENELSIVEKEAEEFLKVCKRNLEDVTRETEEETELCSREMLALIDMVSDFKKSIESTHQGMKSDLSETIDSLSGMSINLVSPSSSLGVKRARML